MRKDVFLLARKWKFIFQVQCTMYVCGGISFLSVFFRLAEKQIKREKGKSTRISCHCHSEHNPPEGESPSPFMNTYTFPFEHRLSRSLDWSETDTRNEEKIFPAPPSVYFCFTNF